MANERLDRHDTNPVTGALGQAASAMTAAGTDALGRAIDIVSKQIAAAVVGALRPREGEESPGTRLDDLLNRYRDVVGQLGMNLPLVARRLSRSFESPDGQRLLFRASVSPRGTVSDDAADLPRMPSLKELADIKAASNEPVRIEVSRALARAIRNIPGLPDDRIERARALDALSMVIKNRDIRNISSTLDRVKYAIRRDRTAAYANLERDLGWLTDPELRSRLEQVAALKRVLGERCAREMLHGDFLVQLSSAIDRSMDDPSREATDGFAEAFAFAGITLSSMLSVIAFRTGSYLPDSGSDGTCDWLVLDHGHDRAYEVRRTRINDVMFLEVYGPADHPYRATIGGTRLLLPVRVHDASHGIAVWSIDKRLIQEMLDLRPGNTLKAWEIGNGTTPVALFMTDHREGDLGPYLELGLACLATPKKDPLGVGMVMVDEIVVGLREDASGELLSRDAGNVIWNARKREGNLRFEHDDRSATMTLCTPEGAKLMAFTVPRGGDGSSTNVPLFMYTWKGGTLHRTLIERSGREETMRAGGAGVALGIEDAGKDDRLCDNLRRFGIVGEKSTEPVRRPLFTVWSERVSAEMHAPEVVVIPEDD